MSQETSEWLNQNVLVGFTDKRGKAWHYRKSDQGVEGNHYPGAIPVADVRRRLFDFQGIAVPIYFKNPDTKKYEAIEGNIAMVTNDTYEVLGIHSDGYQGHQYDEWLRANVETILSDELGIGSAGLLRNRAQAWLSVEVPENKEVGDGASKVIYRPNLIAATSFDGSLASIYKRTVTNVVCDNTLRAGLCEEGQEYRVKHTKNSGLRIHDAREALEIITKAGDDFEVEVNTLANETVTDAQWAELLETLVPIAADAKTSRGETVALKKRETLEQLYANDTRVAPWAGTTFGVLQAFNTYQHHYATVRKASRAERNFTNVLSGATEAEDARVLAAVSEILGKVAA